MTLRHRPAQRRNATLVPRVHRRTLLNEIFHYVQMTLIRRKDQRRPAIVIPSIHRRTRTH